ncbi:MAG: hypothetical protein Q8N99_01500 [Nanoarchaeota archaeon]|nr:hypothetical protein [Nanoarchaeota archaeon]
MKKVPYMPKLEKIVGLFERSYKKFPYGFCVEATRVVHLLMGLEEVGGTKPDHIPFHACNYDPKLGVYVDITASQYSYSTDKILIFKPQFRIFYQTEEHTKKQKEYDSPEMRNAVNRILRLAKRDPLFR